MYKMVTKKTQEERLVEAYIPRDSGIVSNFLCTKPHKMRSLGKSFPGYKSALFFKAVNEVVKDYDVRAVFDLKYGQVTSPSYSYLEVGRGKREELLVTGMRFLIKDKKALAAYVCPGWGTVDLYMSYNEKDSDIALGLMEKVDKYMDENNFYKGEKIDAAGQFLPIPDLDFDSVQLPDEQKQKIKVGALDFFSKKELYEKSKIPFKRGMIFTGVPGTGKTLVGKILMNKVNCTFIWVDSSAVNFPSDIKYLFKMAGECSPAILYFEDVDDFLKSKGCIDSLKTTMDGMKNVEGIVTILVTNSPSALPRSLISRPSRFDDVLVFQLPDKDLRYKILSKVAEPLQIENKENILKELADKTEKLTGAHLKELLIYALLLSADVGRDIIIEDDIAKALVKVFGTIDTVDNKIQEVDMKSLVCEVRKQLNVT